MKTKIRFCSLLLLIVLLMAGCSKEIEGQEIIQEAMQIEQLTSQLEEDGDLYLIADVVVPRFSDYLTEYILSVGSVSEEGFSTKLCEHIAQEIENVISSSRHSVKVNLSELDPEKTKWSQNELNAVAKQAAYEREIESYCMDIIRKNTMPEIN